MRRAVCVERCWHASVSLSLGGAADRAACLAFQKLWLSALARLLSTTDNTKTIRLSLALAWSSVSFGESPPPTTHARSARRNNLDSKREETAAKEGWRTTHHARRPC